MPELPEVEISARLVGDALAGAEIESARAPGIKVLRTFDPPLDALAGRRVTGISRRGKLFVVEAGGELALLVHLMSAGRLQLYDEPAKPRDRTSRLLVRVSGGRELRLREFGRRQAAWAKLLTADGLAGEETLAGLGPEAWPDPPPLGPLLDAPRPLNALLRDQRVIAGIGRSWADEILHAARLSPFKRGSDLADGEAARLREAVVETLGGALDAYERDVSLPIPDRLPMPLAVHRHAGEPCPRCGEAIAAVHYEDYDLCYCPACQTEGRLLKDRRRSRLLR